MAFEITNSEDRKMEVDVDPSGAVLIQKKWLNPESPKWNVSEMIVNGDEWDRINAVRETIKKG